MGFNSGFKGLKRNCMLFAQSESTALNEGKSPVSPREFYLRNF